MKSRILFFVILLAPSFLMSTEIGPATILQQLDTHIGKIKNTQALEQYKGAVTSLTNYLEQPETVEAVKTSDPLKGKVIQAAIATREVHKTTFTSSKPSQKISLALQKTIKKTKMIPDFAKRMKESKREVDTDKVTVQVPLKKVAAAAAPPQKAIAPVVAPEVTVVQQPAAILKALDAHIEKIKNTQALEQYKVAVTSLMDYLGKFEPATIYMNPKLTEKVIAAAITTREVHKSTFTRSKASQKISFDLQKTIKKTGVVNKGVFDKRMSELKAEVEKGTTVVQIPLKKAIAPVVIAQIKKGPAIEIKAPTITKIDITMGAAKAGALAKEIKAQSNKEQAKVAALEVHAKLKPAWKKVIDHIKSVMKGSRTKASEEIYGPAKEAGKPDPLFFGLAEAVTHYSVVARLMNLEVGVINAINEMGQHLGRIQSLHKKAAQGLTQVKEIDLGKKGEEAETLKTKSREEQEKVKSLEINEKLQPAWNFIIEQIKSQMKVSRNTARKNIYTPAKKSSKLEPTAFDFAEAITHYKVVAELMRLEKTVINAFNKIGKLLISIQGLHKKAVADLQASAPKKAAGSDIDTISNELDGHISAIKYAKEISIYENKVGLLKTYLETLTPETIKNSPTLTNKVIEVATVTREVHKNYKSGTPQEYEDSRKISFALQNTIKKTKMIQNFDKRMKTSKREVDKGEDVVQIPTADAPEKEITEADITKTLITTSDNIEKSSTLEIYHKEIDSLIAYLKNPKVIAIIKESVPQTKKMFDILKVTRNRHKRFIKEMQGVKAGTVAGKTARNTKGTKLYKSRAKSKLLIKAFAETKVVTLEFINLYMELLKKLEVKKLIQHFKQAKIAKTAKKTLAKIEELETYEEEQAEIEKLSAEELEQKEESESKEVERLEQESESKFSARSKELLRLIIHPLFNELKKGLTEKSARKAGIYHAETARSAEIAIPKFLREIEQTKKYKDFRVKIEEIRAFTRDPAVKDEILKKGLKQKYVELASKTRGKFKTIQKKQTEIWSKDTVKIIEDIIQELLDYSNKLVPENIMKINLDLGEAQTTVKALQTIEIKGSSLLKNLPQYKEVETTIIQLEKEINKLESPQYKTYRKDIYDLYYKLLVAAERLKYLPTLGEPGDKNMIETRKRFTHKIERTKLEETSNKISNTEHKEKILAIFDFCIDLAWWFKIKTLELETQIYRLAQRKEISESVDTAAVLKRISEWGAALQASAKALSITEKIKLKQLKILNKKIKTLKSDITKPNFKMTLFATKGLKKYLLSPDKEAELIKLIKAAKLVIEKQAPTSPEQTLFAKVIAYAKENIPPLTTKVLQAIERAPGASDFNSELKQAKSAQELKTLLDSSAEMQFTEKQKDAFVKAVVSAYNKAINPLAEKKLKKVEKSVQEALLALVNDIAKLPAFAPLKDKKYGAMRKQSLTGMQEKLQKVKVKLLN
jgi:hypothetical protein